MTSEIEKTEKKFPTFKLVLLIIFTIFLFYFYNTLISFGSSHLLALLILLFFFLVFIGMLFKGKGFSSSLFKHNRYNNLQQNEREKYLKELEKRHVRRIDHIKLDSKYGKPIIRKCPNCRMLLPHFVKKCPNCGDVLTS